jgi:hypothetical protein
LVLETISCYLNTTTTLALESSINLMKHSLNIEVRDAETPAKTILEIGIQDTTAETVASTVAKIKEIIPTLEGLTNDDTVSGQLTVESEENDSFAKVEISNVSKAEAVAFISMVNATLNAGTSTEQAPEADEQVAE